jgi:hypothetical protein
LTCNKGTVFSVRFFRNIINSTIREGEISAAKESEELVGELSQREL